ncbi:YfiR family protein [Sphaerotilus sp.]|uniref:YfiR family protein n=1 Tax=Sphaerotilus sp. TaxID=2093942 RepID=UPI002ACDDB98|nr:YfiR family protein [Sphaerotilus sp.]MDZ7856042.1 YfiR family protein [Sphaerotilus sp.]
MLLPLRWCGRSRCAGWTVRLAGAAVLSVLGWAPPADAAPEESVLQAAYVLNFAKFTEWPPTGQPGKSGAMQLCQFGARDELAQALRALEGRSLQGVPVQWRRVSRVDEVRGCHVLFIAEAGLPLGPLGGLPVLTVSDLPDFVQQGGVIGLVRQSGRLRFEVNRGVAQAAGLRLSADLLSLAMRVVEGPARREGGL